MKFVFYRNRTSHENFELKICTHAKFQLEILTVNVISGIVYFPEIILESLRNVNEQPPPHPPKKKKAQVNIGSGNGLVPWPDPALTYHQ